MKSIDEHITFANLQIKALEEKLQALQKEVFDISRAKEIWSAKLEAFQVAQETINDQEADENTRPAKRTRAPSHAWKQVFQLLERQYKSGFGYHELSNAAEQAGIVIAGPSLRSKMAQLKNNGLAEPIGTGQFRLTDSGKLHFDAVSPETNEGPDVAASGPSKQSGDVSLTTIAGPPSDWSSANEDLITSSRKE